MNRPTLIDKLKTVRCLDELKGFETQLNVDKVDVPQDVSDLIADMKVEFLRGKLPT